MKHRIYIIKKGLVEFVLLVEVGAMAGRSGNNELDCENELPFVVGIIG